VLSSERRVVRVVNSTVAACRKQPDRPFLAWRRQLRGVVHAWRSGCFKREVTMIDALAGSPDRAAIERSGVGGRRRDRTRRRQLFAGSALALVFACRAWPWQTLSQILSAPTTQPCSTQIRARISCFRRATACRCSSRASTSPPASLQGPVRSFEVYILESGHGLPSRCNDQSTFASGDFDPTNPFTPTSSSSIRTENWSASWRATSAGGLQPEGTRGRHRVRERTERWAAVRDRLESGHPCA